jgi:hypothetical protein
MATLAASSVSLSSRMSGMASLAMPPSGLKGAGDVTSYAGMYPYAGGEAESGDDAFIR